MKSTLHKMHVDIGQGGDVEERRKGFDPLTTPYMVDEEDFPINCLYDEQFAFLVRYAVLAPSSYNTQPWKFQLNENGIAVFADYTRRLPVADPDNRELLMGIGAAIMNLRVAAAHFGFGCRVTYNLSGDSERPIAFVGLSRLPAEPPDTALAVLFPWITRRHTNRNPFLLARVPETVLHDLRLLGEGSLVSLSISTDGKLITRMADLVAYAERMRLGDATFRKEFAEWIRPNWTQKTDGMTGASFGVDDLPSTLGPWATKVLDIGRVRAAKDKNLCVEAPGLIVICGDDAVPVWLETGEVMERLLLTIVKSGLQFSFFNMPIELPEVRGEMRTLIGTDSWPQLLVRIGYCLSDPSASPRRPVDDVIIQGTIVS